MNNMSQILQTIKQSIKLCLLLWVCGSLACGPPSYSPNSVHTPQRARYYTGNIIRYYCREGYVANGGASRRICRSSHAWSGAPLRCIRQRPRVARAGCQQPPNPANGVVNFSPYDLNQGLFHPSSVVSYVCNTGFTVVGSHQIRCLNNVWSGNPRCKEIPRVTCKLRPPPEHGHFEEDQVNKDTWYSGDVARFQCQHGYRLTGSPHSTCLATGTWSSNIPNCIRTPTCYHRPPSRNGAYITSQRTKTTWNVGDVATYVCSNGYVITGSRTSRCLSSGRWSTDLPTCRRTCPHRPSPQHGSYEPRGKSTWLGGESMRFICSNGYLLSGERISRCLSSGRWTSTVPSCNPSPRVSCSHRYPPQNGGYAQPQLRKSTWHVNDEATYVCNEGYTLSGSRISRCLSTGRWSTSLPTCEQRRTCPHRPPPQHGAYAGHQLTKSEWSFGDIATYVCDPGYALVRSNARCLDGGIWSNSVPECHRNSNPTRNPTLRPTAHPTSYSTARPTPYSTATCSLPNNPAHGSIRTSHQGKETFSEGEYIQYECHGSYRIDGEGRVGCFGGSWTHTPSCRRRTCPHRPPPQHGAYAGHQLTKSEWSFGDIATYVCDPGYALVRSNARCLDGGIWSNSVPECHRNSNPTHSPTLRPTARPTPYFTARSTPYSTATCSLPNNPAHGSIRTSHQGKETFSEGEYIQYECHGSYRIDGEGRVGCFGGSWTHTPSCRPATQLVDATQQTARCTLPGYPQNGRIRTDPVGQTSFSEGEFIYYECNTNFQVDGDGKVGCYGGRWSYVPACRRSGSQSSSNEDESHPTPHGVTCPHRPAPANGIYIQDLGKTVWRPGDIARYRCNPNYVLVGHDYTDCRSDGTWRFSVPKCRNSCDRPQNPPFGSVHSHPENKQKFAAGDTIAYRCQNGYRLEGESRIHCQNHGWTSTPRCVYQVTCPHRPAPRNGVYIQDQDKTQWFEGDIARYRCEQGYIMVGHSYIDCLSDGTWRFHVPTCQSEDFQDSQTHPPPTVATHAGRCSQPPRIPHSTVHSSPASKRVYVYGDRVQYRCDAGYVISGSSRVTCSRNGWSQLPSCRENGCTRPSTPSNGFILPTTRQRFSNSDFVLYQCSQGYSLQGIARVTCTDNRWSHVPMCRHPCPQRSPPSHGSYAQQQGSWLSGDVAEFTCPEGYLLIGQTRSTCQMDGTWQYEVPTCRREESQSASCRGNCGLVDAGGCGCDYKCSHYFDCCKDFGNFCQSIAD